ncbi:TIGR03862 family flavoprotein [Kozakia baliensis]|uniref:TIGR03862 family flavoprotein n=1 Tax=Kozakia baliensis TaxID=153496 RepID=UPI00087B5F6F|nr:TIGR03862 family flavoprotein [Kozakia baliensis]AOX20203.1 NAD(FAD)-utilizing dehydrogenase [Kozakia baliensis]
MSHTSHIAVIGTGPAGLSAAEALSSRGYAVSVFDQMPSAGRKFLLAGRSGLNLTHNEPLEKFLDRYGAQRDWLEFAIRAYPPEALRSWAEGLGQACFTGTSGRVFPTVMKASPLLRAWLARLRAKGVVFEMQHRWIGWDEDDLLVFETPQGPKHIKAAATILALGGASWARMGSDGRWTKTLPESEVAPFKPSNCGFRTDLGQEFQERHQGDVLHSVNAAFEGAQARGDITITHEGIEGGPIYTLSPPLRDAVLKDGEACVELDLRPALSEGELTERIAKIRPRESLSNKLRKIGLSAVARAVLRGSLPAVQKPENLAHAIKNVHLRLIGIETVERAISSAGGLRRSALDDCFMLRSRPGVFAAGEMLDWEAPTGGYLLQACFATGVAAALGVESWLTRNAT